MAGKRDVLCPALDATDAAIVAGAGEKGDLGPQQGGVAGRLDGGLGKIQQPDPAGACLPDVVAERAGEVEPRHIAG